MILRGLVISSHRESGPVTERYESRVRAASLTDGVSRLEHGWNEVVGLRAGVGKRGWEYQQGQELKYLQGRHVHAKCEDVLASTTGVILRKSSDVMGVIQQAFSVGHH